MKNYFDTVQYFSKLIFKNCFDFFVKLFLRFLCEPKKAAKKALAVQK